jgi:hypothetical protein
MPRKLDPSLSNWVQNELTGAYAPVRKHTKVVDRTFKRASNASAPDMSSGYAPIRKRMGFVDRGLQSVFDFLGKGLGAAGGVYEKARSGTKR